MITWLEDLGTISGDDTMDAPSIENNLILVSNNKKNVCWYKERNGELRIIHYMRITIGNLITMSLVFLTD